MIRSAISSEADYFQRQAPAFDEAPAPRTSNHPPSNMNVQNGYADVDRPSPDPFTGRDIRYQAVAEAAAGLRTPQKPCEEKTIFDAEGILIILVLNSLYFIPNYCSYLCYIPLTSALSKAS